MRLTELSLEKYGCYLERTIAIPDDAGLTVIYGPNEAGKSTCLEAISDFLFGIPKLSPRGETYGYPGMRIGTAMRIANGEVLRLLRRKGYGKTLVDANGVAHDDSLLASTVLGAANRGRFETLFGLNHETLRSGGKDLLDANGDIGRLIVEAGGGLRAMVRRLEAIDKEADSLFAKSRSASRKFYQALSDYETAESKAKAHLLSRDTYEEARKKAENAKIAAETLRSERLALSVLISGLGRVLRVGPILRERDQLIVESEAFADTASYPEEFSTKVRDALKAREDAEEAHDDAVERRDKVKGKIDSLSVSPNLAAAEKVITLLSERAVQVSNARGSRPNRSRDLDIEEAKLHPLRGMLGLSPTASVAEMLPERAAIDRVQSLAAEALKRGSALDTAEERVSEFADALGQIEARIAEDKALGYDRSLGVASSQFGSLVVQKASMDARRRNAEDERLTIEDDVVWLGVASVDELATLSCPAAEEVRAEQTARETIKTNCLEQERLKRKADDEIAAGIEGIEALEAGGPIATVAAIAEARGMRDALWRPIRAAFVEGRAEDSPEARRNAAEAFEGRVGEADGLSDRRADEAERVASRMELERRVARARRNAAEAEREIAEFAKQMTVREEAFASAYPQLSKRFPALSGLLEFSTRRKDLLDRVRAARVEAADIGVKTNELAPVVELMERMEAKFGLDATAGFAARVEAVQAAITEYGQRHAEHRRDLNAREETEAKLKAATIKRDALRSEQEAWDERWPDAIKALGGSATTSPAEGSKLVTEWAAAAGILTTIAEIRKRLERMDDEEAALLDGVSRTARELEIDVVVDGVAGAQTLQKRWDENESLRVKRDGLKDEYEEAKVEAETSESALQRTEEILAALASAIGIETEGLSAAAARFDSRRALEGRVAEAEPRAMEAGDRLPIATLEKEWANRGLDAVRASLEDAQVRSKQIEIELERAILKEKEGLDALAAFASESEVNRAIVERESATAEMHAALERYLELALASDLLGEAMAQVRAEQQDPLVARAGVLFAAMTEGEFVGIETDVDDKGLPVVKGKRANAELESISKLSDGARDQLFLAFRLASLESYGESAEPLPFVADDILVHFDDARAKATLGLLATFGAQNQVLLFTHHESVRDAATELVKGGLASIVELAKAT